MRVPFLILCAVLLSGALAPVRDAEARGAGPGRVLRPKPERTDAELYDKAMRIQARMWQHISPEGLLVYRHRPGATPDELSHDALTLADAAIWTGCYAASQACRWSVTRDPDALAQVRVLASGLALLSDVTDVPGRLCRTVGRKLPNEALPSECRLSTQIGGLYFRDDVSRDQLAGICLGWAAIHRYVEDEALRKLAGDQSVAIAQRLYADDMWLRTASGSKTEHGELSEDVEGIPFLENGPFAAIGLAPFVVGDGATDSGVLRGTLDRLIKRGWRDALDSQHTSFRHWMSASNVQMVHIALTAIRLKSRSRTMRKQALDGLAELRPATRGWWNGGILACQLIAGPGSPRRAVADELRVVLHVMSEDEQPPLGEQSREIGRIATVAERGISSWSWKARLERARWAPPGAGKDPTVTFTRADWLFAYWLARAAGDLRPLSGPGAVSESRCPAATPAWALPDAE